MAVGYDLYSANIPTAPGSPGIPGMDAGRKTKRVDPLEAIRKRFAGQRQLIEKQGRRAVSSADESLKRRLASQGMLGSGAGARLMGQQRRDIQESVGESLVGLGAGENQAIQQEQQFQQQFDEGARRFNEQVRQWNEQFGFNKQTRLDKLAQDQRDFASDMFLNKLNFYTGLKQLKISPIAAKNIANEMFDAFQVSVEPNGTFVIPPISKTMAQGSLSDKEYQRALEIGRAGGYPGF